MHSADRVDAVQGEASRFLLHSSHLLHVGQIYHFQHRCFLSSQSYHLLSHIFALIINLIILKNTLQVLCALLLVNILALLWGSRRVKLPGLK